MQVSAVSANSSKTVFNTRANYRTGENCTEVSLNYLTLNSKNNEKSRKEDIFDAINEWKYFCHNQIEKGNIDIIV